MSTPSVGNTVFKESKWLVKSDRVFVREEWWTVVDKSSDTNSHKYKSESGDVRTWKSLKRLVDKVDLQKRKKVDNNKPEELLSSNFPLHGQNTSIKSTGRKKVNEVVVNGITWELFRKGNDSSQDLFIHPVIREVRTRKWLRDILKTAAYSASDSEVRGFTSDGEVIKAYIRIKVHYPKARLKFEQEVLDAGLQLKYAYGLLNLFIRKSNNMYEGKGKSIYHLFKKPGKALQLYRHDYKDYIKVFISAGIVEVFAPHIPKVHSTIYKVFIHEVELQRDDSGNVYGFQSTKCENKVDNYRPSSFRLDPINENVYDDIIKAIKPYYNYCYIRNDRETLHMVLNNLKNRLSAGLKSELTEEDIKKMIRSMYSEEERLQYVRDQDHRFQYENDPAYRHYIDVELPKFTQSFFERQRKRKEKEVMA